MAHEAAALPLGQAWPIEIMRSRIGEALKLAYLALKRRAAGPHGATVVISLTELADELGRDKRSARRWLFGSQGKRSQVGLVELGLVTVVRQVGECFELSLTPAGPLLRPAREDSQRLLFDPEDYRPLAPHVSHAARTHSSQPAAPHVSGGCGASGEREFRPPEVGSRSTLAEEGRSAARKSARSLPEYSNHSFLHSQDSECLNIQREADVECSEEQLRCLGEKVAERAEWIRQRLRRKRGLYRWVLFAAAAMVETDMVRLGEWQCRLTEGQLASAISGANGKGQGDGRLFIWHLKDQLRRTWGAPPDTEIDMPRLKDLAALCRRLGLAWNDHYMRGSAA